MDIIAGKSLLKNKGGLVPASTALEKVEVVAFYFAASWCPPCKVFTPILAEFHQALKEDNAPFEVIYVPLDKTKDEFRKFFKEYHGDWYAIPHGDPAIQKLRRLCGVLLIPQLMVFHSSGILLSGSGKSDIRDLGFHAWEQWSGRLASQAPMEMLISKSSQADVTLAQQLAVVGANQSMLKNTNSLLDAITVLDVAALEKNSNEVGATPKEWISVEDDAVDGSGLCDAQEQDSASSHTIQSSESPYDSDPLMEQILADEDADSSRTPYYEQEDERDKSVISLKTASTSENKYPSEESPISSQELDKTETPSAHVHEQVPNSGPTSSEDSPTNPSESPTVIDNQKHADKLVSPAANWPKFHSSSSTGTHPTVGFSGVPTSSAPATVDSVSRSSEDAHMSKSFPSTIPSSYREPGFRGHLDSKMGSYPCHGHCHQPLREPLKLDSCSPSVSPAPAGAICGTSVIEEIRRHQQMIADHHMRPIATGRDESKAGYSSSKPAGYAVSLANGQYKVIWKQHSQREHEDTKPTAKYEDESGLEVPGSPPRSGVRGESSFHEQELIKQTKKVEPTQIQTRDESVECKECMIQIDTGRFEKPKAAVHEDKTKAATKRPSNSRITTLSIAGANLYFIPENHPMMEVIKGLGAEKQSKHQQTEPQEKKRSPWKPKAHGLEVMQGLKVADAGKLMEKVNLEGSVLRPTLSRGNMDPYAGKDKQGTQTAVKKTVSWQNNPVIISTSHQEAPSPHISYSSCCDSAVEETGRVRDDRTSELSSTASRPVIDMDVEDVSSKMDDGSATSFVSSKVHKRAPIGVQQGFTTQKSTLYQATNVVSPGRDTPSFRNEAPTPLDYDSSPRLDDECVSPFYMGSCEPPFLPPTAVEIECTHTVEKKTSFSLMTSTGRAASVEKIETAVVGKKLSAEWMPVAKSPQQLRKRGSDFLIVPSASKEKQTTRDESCSQTLSRLGRLSKILIAESSLLEAEEYDAPKTQQQELQEAKKAFAKLRSKWGPYTKRKAHDGITSPAMPPSTADGLHSAHGWMSSITDPNESLAPTLSSPVKLEPLRIVKQSNSLYTANSRESSEAGQDAGVVIDYISNEATADSESSGKVDDFPLVIHSSPVAAVDHVASEIAALGHSASESQVAPMVTSTLAMQQSVGDLSQRICDDNLQQDNGNFALTQEAAVNDDHQQSEGHKLPIIPGCDSDQQSPSIGSTWVTMSVPLGANAFSSTEDETIPQLSIQTQPEHSRSRQSRHQKSSPVRKFFSWIKESML